MASEGTAPGGQGHMQPAPFVEERGMEGPAERRERGLRGLSVSSRLLAGATTFFFMSFVFAYFYLRSLNIEGGWRPHHVKPDQGLGAAFVACIALSAIALIVAERQQRRWSEWLGLATASLVLGLAAVALQCIEFTVQKFGPTDGAYASVFVGWLAFYMLFVLGTMYWLEIQIATEWRERRKPTARLGQGVTEYEDPDQLLPRGIEASMFYWSFLAGIGVLTWVILYLLQT
jgi:heme/copper-type cytochrome/quinol oxidase subunit 3